MILAHCLEVLLLKSFDVEKELLLMSYETANMLQQRRNYADEIPILETAY